MLGSGLMVRQWSCVAPSQQICVVYWGYRGIMEKKMGTTILYWSYMGIMEKKMGTTIVFWVTWGHLKMKWKLL